MKFEKWENLTISNDFIFSKVMRDKEICKETLENLLNIKIKEIKYIQEQKAIDIRYDAKSIRLDVYVEADEKIYNVEMQVVNNKNLAKRSRYYQGLIDLDIIEKGKTYKNLKESYVIFICTFDPFGENMSKYEFRYYCKDKKELELKDETHKIFFNTEGFEEEKDEKIKTFLKYVKGEKENNKFIEKLDKKIKTIKENKEWRQEYMTLLMREQEIAEENFAKGIKEGIKEGIIKEIKLLKEFGVKEEEIIKRIMLDYNLTKEEAIKYL
ncbi:Rpn family recombination-promoting nuclease/putative transposase [[Clostridium] colinum]|uniref:Rpn family recombination-promoting nuclease/putative transposase n=1 Tax=[Clostridium] colinum TaxID=36835 RepID=UPI002024AEBD|nr:Rpn family recombination-promoting nuclease/putative transposase [[Clostridium] colinum]